MKINKILLLMVILQAGISAGPIWAQTGVEAYNRGDLPAAKTIFSAALNADPKNLEAMSYLGLTNYYLGNYDEAIKLLNEVIKADKNYVGLNYNLGLAYYQKRDYKAALTALEISRQAYGDNPDFLYYVAMTNYNIGDLDKTIAELKKLVEKYPDYGIDPLYSLALTYYYKGMADEAMTQFNKVVQMAPDDTNWDKLAREYIAQLEKSRATKPKPYSFSLYTNFENDSNVGYSSAPSATDADGKLTLFGSAYYKPMLGSEQPLKIGYSYYSLSYGTHTTSNFLGHMGELSYSPVIGGSLLALKTNYNMYFLAGSPYLVNIPFDCRLTFKFLPLAGAWSIPYLGYAIDQYQSATYQARSASTIIIGWKQFLSDYLNISYEMKNSKAKGSGATDDFSYNSSQISANYIQLLPESFSLTLDAALTSKNFTEIDSYSVSTTPAKRTDQIITASAQLFRTAWWETGVLAKVSFTLDRCNLDSSQSALGYGTYHSLAYSLGLTRSF